MNSIKIFLKLLTNLGWRAGLLWKIYTQYVRPVLLCDVIWLGVFLMLAKAGNQVNANVGDFCSVIILLISLDVLYQGRGLHFPVTPFIGKQDSSSTSLEPNEGVRPNVDE